MHYQIWNFCVESHLLTLKSSLLSQFFQWTQNMHLLFAKGATEEMEAQDSTAVNGPFSLKDKTVQSACSLNRTVFSNYQLNIWSLFFLVEAFKSSS